MILAYTRRSAPRWSPKSWPNRLSEFGKTVKTKSPDPTPRNTRKWSALNRSRLAISSATRNMMSPEMMKNIWRRFIVRRRLKTKNLVFVYVCVFFKYVNFSYLFLCCFLFGEFLESVDEIFGKIRNCLSVASFSNFQKWIVYRYKNEPTKKNFFGDYLARNESDKILCRADTFGYKSMEEKVMEINPEKKLNLLLFVKK